jgi:hypothetical protein
MGEPVGWRQYCGECHRDPVEPCQIGAERFVPLPLRLRRLERLPVLCNRPPPLELCPQWFFRLDPALHVKLRRLFPGTGFGPRQAGLPTRSATPGS